MRYKLFTLTSYEPEGAYIPRTVKLQRTACCGERHDYFWAEIHPPFAPPVFGLNNILSLILLAPRFVNEVITESANWPLHVYVCKTKEVYAGSKEIPVNEVEILNWGLLKPLES